jgi:hypothetical protein
VVETLREDADNVARRPPNAHLIAEAARLLPGLAQTANHFLSGRDGTSARFGLRYPRAHVP